MKISAGTISRTIILILALVNQVLSMLGYKVIPIEDDQINDFVTLAFTIITTAVTWWKNNSFTANAIAADEYKKTLKE